MSTPNDRYLPLERLRTMIEADEVDTVVLAFTDMQGRLQGKRLHGRYFLDVALEAGTEGCNYLLAVDVDMNTVDGYAISSWERGYGDMEFVPDWDTLRLLHAPARDRDGAVRPRLARPRSRCRSHRAPSSRRSSTGWPRWTWWRWPAPSWSSSPSTTPTRTPTTAGGAT